MKPVITSARLRFFKLREAAAWRQVRQHYRWNNNTFHLVASRSPVIPDRQAIMEAVRVQQNRMRRLGI